MNSDTNTVLEQKYPWLFLKRSVSVDIVYDLTESDETNDRELSAGKDTMDTANELDKSLKSMGHSASLVPVKEDNFKEVIGNLRGDVVFNQIEENELGFEALSLLEKLKRPVTGADSSGFALSWEKSRVKEMLIAADLPTPRYVVVGENRELKLDGLSYPLFVKAVDDHGSLSITENSVVRNKEQLLTQINWIRGEIGGDALVEEYIDGRELGITVLGNRSELEILPVKEIIFGEEFRGRPQIVTYEAKWKSKSIDYLGTSTTGCPANLSTSEKAGIEKAIKESSKALNARDYARFDVRLKDDIPYIIDYNANPAIGPRDASALPARVFGLTYPEFITAIVAIALKRYQ